MMLGARQFPGVEMPGSAPPPGSDDTQQADGVWVAKSLKT